LPAITGNRLRGLSSGVELAGEAADAADALSGARACRPRCVRIFSMTGASRIAAMIFSSPPQFGQCSRSRSKPRLSSSAQARALELERHLTGGVALHPFDGQSRALVGAAVIGGVQAAAVCRRLACR
jgi:hypothetical protein